MEALFNAQYVNWIIPTRTELEIEWKTEGIDCIWFVGYPKEAEVNRYKNHFLANIDRFSTVEDIDPKAIDTQIYLTNSIEQLEINIKHMGKDVREIEKSIMNGTPTTPLFIREDGKLRILGGRTRSTIAIMAGKSVTGLVIDRQKMDQVFQPLKKEDFLETGYILTVFETRAVRAKIIEYIEGRTTKLPVFNNILSKVCESDVLKEIEEIKGYLSYN